MSTKKNTVKLKPKPTMMALSVAFPLLVSNSRSTNIDTNIYDKSEGMGSLENNFGFESFDENEYRLQKSHDFLRRLNEQDDNQD